MTGLWAGWGDGKADIANTGVSPLRIRCANASVEMTPVVVSENDGIVITHPSAMKPRTGNQFRGDPGSRFLAALGMTQRRAKQQQRQEQKQTQIPFGDDNKKSKGKSKSKSKRKRKSKRRSRSRSRSKSKSKRKSKSLRE